MTRKNYWSLTIWLNKQRKMNEHDISIRFPPEISSVRGWGSKMILSKNGTWICMGGIASMDGLLNALTMAITCHYNHGCEIIRVLATWGPGPLMRWGNIFYMFTDCRGCFCWWFLPGMLACLRFRCKMMQTRSNEKKNQTANIIKWYQISSDQTFFKFKPSLNLPSLCVACDAPTSTCACVASVASS